MNKLRPRIKTPLSDNILEYFNELKLSIPLNEEFLKIEADFKKFLSGGIANDNMADYFYNSERDYSSTSQIMSMTRYKYIADYGFSILSEKLINELSSQLRNKKVIEVGAGSGFISKCLQDNGINVTPVDSTPIEKNQYKFKKSFTEITIADGPDFIQTHPCDSVIMSWPNYESSFASDILNNMKLGQQLYYCGEWHGGCTGDDRFSELLDAKAQLNIELTEKMQNSSLNWAGIHDQWYVYDIISNKIDYTMML
jgi:hypothetical protein